MKVFAMHFSTLAIVVLAGSSSVVAQLCAPGFLTGQVTVLGDGTVPAAQVAGNDPGLTFFREVLGFNEADVEQTIQNAMDFYNTRYGLDFSQSEPNQLGERTYMNATFFPYQLPFTAHATFNGWLVNRRRETKCFPISAGGFMVGFNGTQTLFGTYGGTEGILTSGAVLDYGYYSIPVCRQSPIQIRRTTPIPNEDRRLGFFILFYELYHRGLGQGVERGVFQQDSLPDDASMVRTVGTSVLTFPTVPLLVSVL